MERRKFFGVAAFAATGLGSSACSGSIGSELQQGDRFLSDALARFRSLPGMPVYAIEVESAKNDQLMRLDHLSDRQLLIGSAFKTFIITKCLQDIEEGRLHDTQLVEISDITRVNDSPVFINLAGSVQLRSVLNAICAYSDNTAADVAMAQVGADRVRAFIASAGLISTRIPNSIRILESYLSGAPLNADIGWSGIQQLLQGILPGAPRPAVNNEVSILSTVDELVSYYRKAMRGDFFNKPTTVLEFKRLHAQENLLFETLPNTAIYAKIGEANWLGFNARCYAGQMLLCSGTKVTFAFAVNWNESEEINGISSNFIKAVSDALAAIKELYGVFSKPVQLI